MRSFDKLSHIYFDWSGTLAPSGTKRNFIAAPSESILYPDTLPVLLELRRRGYKLGLIVNTSKSPTAFRKAIEIAGLSKLFDNIRLSNDPGFCKKPCRKIFTVPNPETSLMVGNDLIKDIAGATAVGMHTFHIRRHGPNMINLVDLLSKLSIQMHRA